MTDKPALTYPVPVLHLPQKGVTVKIGTDEKERAALAADHGLEAVNAFAAEFLITPWKRMVSGCVAVSTRKSFNPAS
ncbi:Uncharacterised protein [Brucella intermedia]|nr:Uncharacterised protein [Brucella intermedia]